MNALRLRDNPGAWLWFAHLIVVGSLIAFLVMATATTSEYEPNIGAGAAFLFLSTLALPWSLILGFLRLNGGAGDLFVSVTAALNVALHLWWLIRSSRAASLAEKV